MVKEDPSIQAFLNGFDLIPPLNPRDAFFGGRTGAVALYAVADQSVGEEISYVDVTSLYPWVNKTCRYPVGHPQIITRPDNLNLDQYFGLALVDILPPSELFHPVLPVRSGGKLTFPLCKACVTEEQSHPLLHHSSGCAHTDAQRTLRGTWCTPELQEAIRQGYRLLQIHDVWHFPPQQHKTGLFKDYVNTWLKIKQESAEWPRWCQSEDQKQQYLRDYESHEGITLDYAQVQKEKPLPNSSSIPFGASSGSVKTNLSQSLFKNPLISSV